ncbi:MAG: hypothetical protein KGM47_08995, partial [Acidobacteriota bacterium]|nr:hypothetical protein [Acidobacteriota bacterium]
MMRRSQVWIARFRRRATLPALVIALLCALAVLPYAAAQQARGPFLAGEILGLLKSGVTSERVESLASQYGIAFQVTPQIEAELREAGASHELLFKLTQLTPRGVRQPPAHPWAEVLFRAPAGAKILIDTKLAGVTSAQGLLAVPSLAAGQHLLRVEAPGYSP